MGRGVGWGGRGIGDKGWDGYSKEGGRRLRRREGPGGSCVGVEVRARWGAGELDPLEARAGRGRPGSGFGGARAGGHGMAVGEE